MIIPQNDSTSHSSHDEPTIELKESQNWKNSCEEWNRIAAAFISQKRDQGLLLDEEIDFKYLPFIHFMFDDNLNQKIYLYRGDITHLKVDAIVNAARPSLLGGGGIDKAIHARSGPQLLQECKTLHGCKHGETKITRGYNLPSKYVLHTVGPNRDLHEEVEAEELLKQCYHTCLQKIVDGQIRSVALCCIATGAYRFPSRVGCHIALASVRKWLEKYHHLVDKIVFTMWTQEDTNNYAELLPKYFPTSQLKFIDQQ